MKLNDKQQAFAARCEKHGVKVYFFKSKVTLFWPRNTRGCSYSYSAAYQLFGDKSQRPWAKDLKKETKRIIRVRIREQINKGEEVHYSRKEASDPWKWD